MEAKLETQWQLGQMIARFCTNMKKDGTQRRRNKNCISGHYSTLEAYWEQFVSTHDELLLEASRDHEYFKEDFFSEVKRAYQAAIELLQEDRQAITAAAEAHRIETVASLEGALEKQSSTATAATATSEPAEALVTT